MEKDPEKTADASESDRTETATTDSETTTTSTPAAPVRPDTTSATGGGQPSPSPPTHDNVPDGGLMAWLQVLGSAAVLVNTWGVINTFGVFQAYYESSLLSSHSASEISWIGSAQAALLFLVGVIAGPLYDAGYFRHLLAGGLLLTVLGQFMTSLCKLYWQVMLAQGVAMGVGMGMTFLPSAAILGQYFSRHRALALGLSSVGSPVAGTVFPIIFSRVEEKAGFGWATRAIAFILLGLSAIPLAFMRTRVPPTPRKGKGALGMIDATAFRDTPYVLFVAGGFFAFLTLYVGFFYVTLHATSHGIASARGFAPYLVTLLNAGSIVGRIVPNALADRYGSLNLILACTMGSMVLVFGWLGVRDLAGAIVFVVLYGAFSGGVVSLTPSVIVSLSPDMGRVGARMGLSFVVAGIAILIGTPIAGAILGSTEDPRWTGTILYSAFGLLAATLLYFASRLLLFKKKGDWKA
ncbi:hypothetical protein VTJ49DRAFT_1353 [Mycothermus thermophilus]|uniref:Major facilitator superfamily (MFS) profile domain-containing protein n=1 Tax=Humicola insolens TaxID=85995 RepID=A0ABR3VPB5_HUMIN